MPLSVTDLASNGRHWPMLRSLILSDQLPEDRLASLAEDYPLFWAWICKQRRDEAAAAEGEGKSDQEPAKSRLGN